jgi:class 3 adenylate cyclase
MAELSQPLVVLFADICGSTPLYETMGDAVAYGFNGLCLERLEASTRSHAGTVVRSVGDGLLATFPTPDDAFRASVEMQRARYDGDLELKVAFHYGPVIEGFGGDVYGDAVNLAARLSALAKSGEILLTEETAACLAPVNRSNTLHFDTTRLKGKSEPITIHRVCDVDGIPTGAQTLVTVSPWHQHAALQISYQGRQFRLDASKQRLTIGRGRSCDLVVASQYSSRHHATVEARRDRFVLTDCSANGTFVVHRDNDRLFIKRETVQLLGEGTISLGREPNLENVDLIRYQQLPGAITKD